MRLALALLLVLTTSLSQTKKLHYQRAEDEVARLNHSFVMVLVTQGEKYNKVIDIWSRANELVAGAMMDSLKSDT